MVEHASGSRVRRPPCLPLPVCYVTIATVATSSLIIPYDLLVVQQHVRSEEFPQAVCIPHLCCHGNSDIAIPKTSNLLLRSELSIKGLLDKEEEKLCVAAVPGGGGGGESSGTTGMFVFVVFFIIVVSVVVFGSVGGVAPDVTPPVLLLLI